MPLLDHSRLPLQYRRGWSSFHSAWVGTIVRRLNRAVLAEGYLAGGNVTLRPAAEVDVGAFRELQAVYRPEAGATLAPVYVPPPSDLRLEAVYPMVTEVLIYRDEGGLALVGAVELVSPANKDRPESRRAFAAKVHSFIGAGVSVVVVDIVTERSANLHNEWVRLFDRQDTSRMPEDPARPFYAAAYRPYSEAGDGKLDVWLRSLAVGEELPTMSLWLDVDVVVPIELEPTYTEACGDLRIPEAVMAPAGA